MLSCVGVKGLDWRGGGTLAQNLRGEGDGLRWNPVVHLRVGVVGAAEESEGAKDGQACRAWGVGLGLGEAYGCVCACARV